MLASYQLRCHGVALRTLLVDLDAYDVATVGRERSLDHALSLDALTKGCRDL
jgi:hypothetical protein